MTGVVCVVCVPVMDCKQPLGAEVSPECSDMAKWY